MSSTFTDTSNFLPNNVPNVPGAAAGLNSDEKIDNGILPWSKDKSASSAFFPPQAIDPKRWNKLYPYRLLVVDVSGGFPTIVNGRTGASGLSNFSESAVKSAAGGLAGAAAGISTFVGQSKGETGLEYIISQETISGSWIATLPISPQQLNIKDIFAINTSSTMRGIIEEHNGVKFKMISMQGTTGIWPKRPTIEGSIKSPSIRESLLGGTIQAAQNLVENASFFGNIFSGNHPNKPRQAESPLKDGGFSTGYYQALYLAQFLERYAEAKKNPATKNWRLVLDIPKQNQSFIVTPVSFTLMQSQQKTNEILFNIQLKAWKRIALGQAVNAAGGKLPDLDPNLFQRVIDTISATRSTLAASVNLVKAVRSDFQVPFNAMRQTVYALKDAAGLTISAADLPRQIIEDYKDAISDATQILQTLDGDRIQAPSGGGGASSGTNFKTITSGDTAGNIALAIKEKGRTYEGMSSSFVSQGALGEGAKQGTKTDPINNVFKNPEENFDFFNGIELSELELTPQQQLAIQQESQRAELVTIGDLREFRQELLNLALDISNNFGSGDSTYSTLYNKATPKTRATQLTIRENEILNSIFESIQMYDLLTATKAFDDNKAVNNMEYVGGLADEAGISFEQLPSKLLAPVPFGASIEEIAARYMGNADKWIEIATVNNLRSPYIDESGFVLNFISNADGRRFNVDNSENQLFIGQVVTILSDTVPLFIRKITDIEKISDNNYLVTVDGLDNLDNLTIVDNARMQGYLPGTVNSQNQIYIPVSAPSEADDRIFEIPSIDYTSLVKISKVDFLLTENNDIAINSVGDFRLANGLTNLIQALKLKIQTQKGSLLRHLDYGIGLKHGISIADIETGAILNALNEMIQNDPRYEEITKISIRISGSTLGIDMAVTIPNSTGIVPVSFNMRLS